MVNFLFRFRFAIIEDIMYFSDMKIQILFLEITKFNILNETKYKRYVQYIRYGNPVSCSPEDWDQEIEIPFSIPTRITQ